MKPSIQIGRPMRFMLLIKTDLEHENDHPGDEVMAEMWKYSDSLKKSGVLLDDNGLEPTSDSFSYFKQGDDVTVVDGPFAETKELVGGYWLIQAKSLDEAIEWARRAPFVDGELEVRQVYELEDFPVDDNESGWREEEAAMRDDWDSAAAPADVEPKPYAYMGIMHATEQSEAGELPSEADLAATGVLMGEAFAAGIMLGGEGLQPSSHGARVTFTDGVATVTDGPFAETKELVAGFALMQFDSKADARAWGLRWAQNSHDGHTEMRRLSTPAR